MKYARGFLMAWGNFSAVPCPSERWDESARRAMLIMLPLVGLLLGLIVDLVWALMAWIGLPWLLTGPVITAIYFLSTGFIHLDGFMDCSDAVLSRRPELEERQRILKDPSVGSFAVISLIMMIMIFLASAMAMTQEFSMVWAGVFPVVFTISRMMSAGYIFRYPGMENSQYRNINGYTEDGEKKTGMSAGEKAAYIIAGCLPTAVIYVVLLVIYASALHIAVLVLYIAVVIFIPAAVVVIVAAVVGRRDIRQLGGMNGDISGHMMVIGEMAGLLAAAIIINLF